MSRRKKAICTKYQHGTGTHKAGLATPNLVNGLLWDESRCLFRAEDLKNLALVNREELPPAPLPSMINRSPHSTLENLLYPSVAEG